MSNPERTRSSLPNIQDQMPDHIEPGSLLHSIRHPLSHTLWLVLQDLGLNKVPKNL